MNELIMVEKTKAYSVLRKLFTRNFMLNLMHISRLASLLIDNAYCIADPTIYQNLNPRSDVRICSSTKTIGSC